MKKFAIYYKKDITHSVEVKDELLDIFTKKNVKAFAIEVLQEGYDFVFVIGGDGTILKAARFYAKLGIPIFGINLGRLGFLSQSSKKDIENSVEKILAEDFIVEDRVMLQCENYSALNDFVIKGCDSGRTARFVLKINNKYVCDYLADGIIISTPTGSTAYGLSAGGPVLTPSLNAFVIVPICAHTLTARPIVIPDTEKISICVDDKAWVSGDGQETFEFDNEIVINKSNNCAKLALLKESEFYTVLKNKLHWATTPAYEL